MATLIFMLTCYNPSNMGAYITQEYTTYSEARAVAYSYQTQGYTCSVQQFYVNRENDVEPAYSDELDLY